MCYDVWDDQSTGETVVKFLAGLYMAFVVFPRMLVRQELHRRGYAVDMRKLDGD